MRTHKRPSRNCGAPRMLALLLIASFPLILQACASQGLTSRPGVTTGSPDQRPLVCSEVQPVQLHAGKITAAGLDDVQKQYVQDRLAMPDWEAQLRRLFGDTDSTIAAVKKNQAVLDRLCASAH